MNKAIKWAKLQRKLIELQTKELVKTADSKTIVELAIGFPYYTQDKPHEVGEIIRDRVTGQPKRCLTAYDGSVNTDWDENTPSLWFPYHGISEETAYPFIQPTCAEDIYKIGEYATFNDQIMKCIKDTSFSPKDDPSSWEIA